MHPNQLDVPETMVRTLVTEQFPHWRDLPVRRIAASGTVNAIFRIGSSLAARFPLEPGDPDSVHREADTAREILGRTRFPTPEPVAIGEPGHGYPMPWSVQTWLPGTPATSLDPSGSVPFALDLAEFVRGVRAIDTLGRTFPGHGRGGVLGSHNAWMETSIRNSKTILDERELRRLWNHFRTLPPTRLSVMNHGDLIPGNVLVADGRLAGVLDVGGLKAADPALDLRTAAIAWCATVAASSSPAAEPVSPVILIGDLNATVDDRGLRPVSSQPTWAAGGPALSWPAKAPVARIDQTMTGGVGTSETGSDHVPIAARIRL